MADKRAFAKFDVGYLDNPTRLEKPIYYRSMGRILTEQRYIVGWACGVLKVGYTSNGKKRWGPFLARGGTLLDVSNYEELDALKAEHWLQQEILKTHPRAFENKSEAAPYLGAHGAGYLDCFYVPKPWWPNIIEMARS